MVIETENLTMYYGTHRGILNVNLQVQEGEVFGFLGPNGAGKTTTERILMDLIRPTSGSARIFGMDCRREGSRIRSRIGYLPGELKLFEQMTAKSFLNMMGSLENEPPDPHYKSYLCDQLELDVDRKIKEYSRGNKQKIGIVSAFMHKPDLIILDEPTMGLDPLKQQKVIELIQEVKAEGRTVFFSSHILAEVQQVCDRVGIIREGELVKTERVETLIDEQFKQIRFQMRQVPPAEDFNIEGVQIVSREDSSITLRISSHLEEVMKKVLEYGLVDIETQAVTLEEIFLAFYGSRKGGRTDE